MSRPAPTAARPPRDPRTEAAWRRLRDAASAPYRRAGRFAWHFARGKLGLDPVFRSVLEHGVLRGPRVVDIGCGQGLVASLLHACAEMSRRGDWPGTWPALPAATTYTGIELMARDIGRADRAVGPLPLAPSFVCADMRSAALPPCELVLMLDVLHYVDQSAQARLLRRVHDALSPGGRLLLRVGDAADRRRFAISQWVDRVVTAVRGHRVPPTWGRSADDWSALLRGLGFTVRALPMSAGTPFANVLLVADRPESAR